MKKFLSVFVSCVLLLLCVPFSVSADSLPVVLTAAQTLALYGTELPALWYNGQSVSDITFSYYASSRTITDSISEWFSNPFESGYTHYNPFGLYINYNTPTFKCYQFYDSGFLPQEVNKSDLCGYEFLIYRAQFNPASVNESSFDFQLNLTQSISIQGVDRFQTIYGYSIGTANSSRQVNDQRIRNANLQSNLSIYSSESDVTPLVSLQGCVWSRSWSEYFPQVSMPVTNMASASSLSVVQYPTTEANVDGFLYPAPLMQLNIIDTGAQSSSISISKSIYNIRNAAGVSVKEAIDTSGGGQSWVYSQPYVYLIIMCPRIYGDYVIPENKPSGSGTDYTPALNDIINKLDIIAQNLNISVDTSDLEETVISTGNTVINGIINGIKGLFVPTQTDILNFRGDMITLLNSKFSGLSDVHAIQDAAFNKILSGSAMTSLDVPLLDLRPTVNFYLNKADFTEKGMSVITENGVDKLQIPLKPYPDKFGFFYDLLAALIDVVATCSFINMLIQKIHVIIHGVKVVESDGD